MKWRQIIIEIKDERKLQKEKWGHVKKDVTGWLLVIESELEEAKRAWVKQTEGKHSLENELVQVAASAISALESLK